jgi:NitT/TauT family transport system substrate-binding protein
MMAGFASRVTMFFLLVAFLSMVCTNAADAQPKPVIPPASPAATGVRLGYFANVTHAQAVLGVDSGELATALLPTKLMTRTFNAGPSLVEALFAGEIDVGYVGPSPAVNAFLQSRGQGIRVIAGAAADGVVIVARAGSGITKLEDLKGKRIATPQLGNTQDISARHYLIKTLGQASADNIIPIANAEQTSMMARGQIDAAWAVEPWGARLVAEAGGTIIAEEKSLWPNKTFNLTLIVVSPDFLTKHPDAVRKILEVHRSWTKRLNSDAGKHVPELAAALEKLTSKKLSESIIADAISRVRFTDEPLPESISTFAQWAYDLHLAKGVPDVKALVDASILEGLKAADAPAAPAPAPSPTPAKH